MGNFGSGKEREVHPVPWLLGNYLQRNMPRSSANMDHQDKPRKKGRVNLAFWTFTRKPIEQEGEGNMWGNRPGRWYCYRRKRDHMEIRKKRWSPWLVLKGYELIEVIKVKTKDVKG